MLKLNARPEPIAVKRTETALLLVDMQNAFGSKGGMFDLAGHDISGAEAVIKTNVKLVAAAREAGVPVIYVQMAFKPDLSDAGDEADPAYHKELALRMMRAQPELKLLIEDEWDWEFIAEVAPQDGDIVIRKSRYNGFTGTDLDAQLKALGVRNILVAGIATNICVDSTAREAFFKGYWPILVEDAMNHAGPEFNRQSTLWNFEHVLGWVANSVDVIAWMQS